MGDQAEGSEEKDMDALRALRLLSAVVFCCIRIYRVAKFRRGKKSCLSEIFQRRSINIRCSCTIRAKVMYRTSITGGDLSSPSQREAKSSATFTLQQVEMFCIDSFMISFF